MAALPVVRMRKVTATKRQKESCASDSCIRPKAGDESDGNGRLDIVPLGGRCFLVVVEDVKKGDLNEALALGVGGHTGGDSGVGGDENRDGDGDGMQRSLLIVLSSAAGEACSNNKLGSTRRHGSRVSECCTKP